MMSGERGGTMMPGRFGGDWAVEAGKRSQQVQRGKRAALEAERALALATLPKLDSLEAAMQSYGIIRDLLIRGLLSGSQGLAANRSCEAWVHALALKLDTERLTTLERSVAEAQVARQKLEQALARATERTEQAEREADALRRELAGLRVSADRGEAQ
jgi:hypothetical protein